MLDRLHITRVTRHAFIVLLDVTQLHVITIEFLLPSAICDHNDGLYIVAFIPKRNYNYMAVSSYHESGSNPTLSAYLCR